MPTLRPFCEKEAERLTKDVKLTHYTNKGPEAAFPSPNLQEPPLPLPVEAICTTELPPCKLLALENLWLNV